MQVDAMGRRRIRRRFLKGTVLSTGGMTAEIAERPSAFAQSGIKESSQGIPFANVRDYSVVGNGSTIRAVIQSAIDQTSAQGNGIVLKYGVDLMKSAMNSSILLVTPSSVNSVVVDGLGVRLSGVQIRYHQQMSTGSSIYIYDCFETTSNGCCVFCGVETTRICHGAS